MTGIVITQLNAVAKAVDHLHPHKIAVARLNVSSTAAAIRSVRCLLRCASVALMDEPDLPRNCKQLSVFLEELALRRTTVVLSEDGLDAALQDNLDTLLVCRSARWAVYRHPGSRFRTEISYSLDLFVRSI